jgi:hypothetical protein
LGLISLPFQYSLTDIFFPPSGYDVPVLDLAFYSLYYFAGVLLFKSRELLMHLSRHCWFYFFVSVPFFMFLDDPTENFSFGASIVVDVTSWRISNFNILHEGLFYGGWPKVLIAYGRAVRQPYEGKAHQPAGNRPSVRNQHLWPPSVKQALMQDVEI